MLSATACLEREREREHGATSLRQLGLLSAVHPPAGLVCLLCISAAILYVSAVGLNASATATAALTSQQFSHLYLIALYVGVCVCVCVNPLSAVRIKPRLQQDTSVYKWIRPTEIEFGAF